MKQYKYRHDFQQFKTVTSSGGGIYNGKINSEEVKMKTLENIVRKYILENILGFSNKSRPRSKKDKKSTTNTLDSINALSEGRELILNSFRNGIFSMKQKQGKGLNY